MTKHKKRIIGFDMDGVILNNSEPKIKIARKFGFNLELRHTPAEIIRTILPQKVIEEIQMLLDDNHEIALSVPLMKGIKTVLATLEKDEIPHYLISRRKLPEIAIKVLHKHSLWPRYFNERNSFFVNNPEDKDIKAAELGITHFIDDELKVINVLKNVPNRFLFDQFSVFAHADHYIKISSWAEFKKYNGL